jgi:NADPH-dependent curcumin reductase CurA
LKTSLKTNPNTTFTHSECQVKLVFSILNFFSTLAYVGLYGIGQPKDGETIVISNASATVSLTVAELARLAGCRTVGITSTKEKAFKLKNTFDHVIAMEEVTMQGLDKAIKEACPKVNEISQKFHGIGS